MPTHANNDHRWLLWVLAVAMLSLQNMEVLTVGSLADNLANSLEITDAQVGAIFGAYALFYALMNIPAGLAFGRFKATHILALACALFAAGNLIFASAETTAMAYTGRMLTGVGGGLFFLGYVAISAASFSPALFATMFGVCQLVKFLLAMLVLALMPLFFQLGGDWRIYFYFVGLIFLPFIPILLWAGRSLPDPESPAGADRLRSIWNDLVEVCRDPQILRIVLIGFLASAGVMAFGGLWYLPFAQDTGFPSRDADNLDSLLMLCLGLGMTAAGWLSDRLQRRKVLLVIGLVMTALSMLGLILWVDPPLVVEAVLVTVMAVSGAAYFVLLYVMTKESVPARLATAASGVVNTAVYVGLALQQYLPGWILNVSGAPDRGAAHTPVLDYQIALMIYPPAVLISLLFAWTLRETGSNAERL
ncbi:MAG: MFS transporter [Pseudomonadota bacterium]